MNPSKLVVPALAVGASLSLLSPTALADPSPQPAPPKADTASEDANTATELREQVEKAEANLASLRKAQEDNEAQLKDAQKELEQRNQAVALAKQELDKPAATEKDLQQAQAALQQAMQEAHQANLQVEALK